MADVDPPKPMAQLSPQPDFTRFKQALEQVTTEFGNLANFSPVAQGNALMHQMQQFQQQMQQQFQQLQQSQQQMQQQFQQSQQQMQQQFQQQMQQMQQFQQSLQGMQQQTNQNFVNVRNDIQTLRDDISTNHRVTEYNSIARLENSFARKSDHPLIALRDYTTNTDILGFPTTPAQLSNMTDVGLDPILRSLSLPVNGTVGIKRQRLKFHIGLADMS